MKAVQLDDKSADAHTSLAVFKFLYEYDWAGCESEFHRALALNPNYAYAHDKFGLALALEGRLDEAVAEGKRAAELDPLSPEILVDAIFALAWQGKYQAAMDLANRAVGSRSGFFLFSFCARVDRYHCRENQRRRPGTAKGGRDRISLRALPDCSGMPMGRQETAPEQWPL